MAMISGEGKLDSLTESVKVLRDQIKAVVPLYDAANYSEDNLKDAKADRTTLNKFAKALNDKKIAFRTEFMKPFEELEDVVKDAVKIIDDASEKIGAVIKAVEGREKLARQALINEIWNATKCPVPQLQLSQIQKPEWMVKATSKKAITEGMVQAVDEVVCNIAMLQQMVKAEDREAIKLYYLCDLDFKKSVTYAQKLKLSREEQENKPIESAPVSPAPPLPPAPPSAPVAPPPAPTAPAADPVISRTFKVTVPKSVMIKLGDFMAKEGIPFEVVAKS